ncbi:MAG: acyltransferase [Pseudomonadota bacterium]|nr:acyltransferase [Pseudomonadota bacterium]
MKPLQTGKPDAAASRPRSNLALLDSARGIAIIAVFLYHSLYQAFGRDELDWNGWVRSMHAPGEFFPLYPITLGWTGVPIFFVISGFCIHLSSAKIQPLRLTDFYARRWFRIYPPFLVTLLFFALVFPYTRLDLHTRWGLWQFFSHFFLVHNLNARTEHGIVVAWWSVAVEFQLYLLYPLLSAAAQRSGWQKVLLWTAVIEFGLRALGEAYTFATNNPIPALVQMSPFYYLFSWCAGAALADAHLKGESLPFGRTSAYAWAGALIISDFFKPLKDFSFTLAALATAAVISRRMSAEGTLAAKKRGILGGLVQSHLKLVGRCSYSIYLIHHPIVEAWPRLVRHVLPAAPAHPLFMLACCLTSWSVVVPASYLLYRYVETPSIELGKQFVNKLRHARAGRGPAGEAA